MSLLKTITSILSSSPTVCQDQFWPEMSESAGCKRKDGVEEEEWAAGRRNGTAVRVRVRVSLSLKVCFPPRNHLAAQMESEGICVSRDGNSIGDDWTASVSDRLQALNRKWRRTDCKVAAKPIKRVKTRLSRTYHGQSSPSSEPSGQSRLALQTEVRRMHLLWSAHGQR